MGWDKREAVTNLYLLGDAEGNHKSVAGLLIGTPFDKMYPDKMNYEIVLKNGETVLLSGSASLGRQLIPDDIGKFVQCTFEGWGRSANGKFKQIDVKVWEGEPTDNMKKWPRYGEEFAKPKARPVQPAKPKAKPADDDFGAELPPEPEDDFGKTEDDDLPF